MNKSERTRTDFFFFFTEKKSLILAFLSLCTDDFIFWTWPGLTRRMLSNLRQSLPSKMLIFSLHSLIYSWVFSQTVWHVVSWFSMWKCFDAFANFACINFLAFAQDFWALLISLYIFLFLLFLIIPGSLTTLCWVVSAFSWIVFSGQWSAFSASPSILPSCQEIPVQEWQASLSDMTHLALCSLPAFFFFIAVADKPRLPLAVERGALPVVLLKHFFTNRKCFESAVGFLTAQRINSGEPARLSHMIQHPLINATQCCVTKSQLHHALSDWSALTVVDGI